jgi:hypothetical protein
VDRGNPRQIVLKTPVSETTRVKWTGGAAQAVECLLCNCEALNSNPSSTEKKKKKPKKQIHGYVNWLFYWCGQASK